MDMALDAMMQNKIHLTCIRTIQTPQEQ